MSFVPVVPVGGYAGWAFLKRTEPTQKAAFEAQGRIQRDEAYFRERIGTISTAEELVADRRLLRISLGAFGLEADANNRYFIRKVLEEGTLRTDALAIKLTDQRYRDLSAAFGFDDPLSPRTKLSDFADGILSRWRTQQFEVAVGQVNESLRLAMNATREIAKIASSEMGENAAWFSLIGQPPLRKVIEGAFGLPTAFGALDIDLQKQMLQDKARATFGESTVAQFADPARRDDLIKRYLLRSQMGSAGAGFSAANTALAMLQSMSNRTV